MLLQYLYFKDAELINNRDNSALNILNLSYGYPMVSWAHEIGAKKSGRDHGAYRCGD